MSELNKSKFIKGNLNLKKLNFSGTINNDEDANIISTVNPLYLAFQATTEDGNLLEFTIYGEAQGDLVTGFGFAEIELNKDDLAPLYLLSRFTITGSATNDKISLVGKGDLRNIYQLAGLINFNVDLNAKNSIIDKENTTISGFLQYENPDTTLAPTTMKRLPDSLYNKHSTETNINKLLRAYDKEILRIRSRIKMIQTDTVIDLARHVALINNFSHLTPDLSPKLFDPEDYRKTLKKINDVIMLEDSEDMIREAIRFFTDAEPEIVDLTKYKIQLGSSRIGKDTYAIDRDLLTFTSKVIVLNPNKKKLNRSAIIAFLQLFIPAHIKLILQFEDGEIINL
jgi:hypothetical protein